MCYIFAGDTIGDFLVAFFLSTLRSDSIKGRMKNKWWTLFYYAAFHFSWSFVQGTPEKLTQEQVLEELGVKIETKGKKSQQQNCFFPLCFTLWAAIYSFENCQQTQCLQNAM